MKQFLLSIIFAGAMIAADAQVNLTSVVYRQNFDALDTVSGGTGSSVMPAGWTFYEGGQYADTKYKGNNGSGTLADSYSFGSYGSTERAFGSLCGTKVNAVTYGVYLQNTTGVSFDQVEVSYKAEQWRNHDASNDTVRFYYSKTATGVNDPDNSKWTAVTALNMISVVTSPTGTLNGNTTSAVKKATISIPGSIAGNGKILFRWTDADSPGNDDALGIDSVIIRFAHVVNVSTAVQLQDALEDAQPGYTIQMSDGTYNLYAETGSISKFQTIPVGVDGTEDLPITLTGTLNAVITNGNANRKYGVWFTGNKYWILKGFTVRQCNNGIKIDSSQHIIVDKVKVRQIGKVGIAMSLISSYNTVQYCDIDSTGLVDAGVGEGVYIGTDQDSWCAYNHCLADTSNYNQVLYNTFGAHISAENVDAKEFTKGGLVKGNTFNGSGLSNVNGANTWVEIKGNYYIVEYNTGTNTVAGGDGGLATAIKQTGWGDYNTFRNNVIDATGCSYGVTILKKSRYFCDYQASHNLVENNTLIGVSNEVRYIVETCLGGRQAAETVSEKKVDENLDVVALVLGDNVQLRVNNPATATPVNVRLMSMNGAELSSKRVMLMPGTNSVKLASPGLAAGVYIISITGNNLKTSRAISIVR